MQSGERFNPENGEGRASACRFRGRCSTHFSGIRASKFLQIASTRSRHGGKSRNAGSLASWGLNSHQDRPYFGLQDSNGWVRGCDVSNEFVFVVRRFPEYKNVVKDPFCLQDMLRKNEEEKSIVRERW